MKSRLLTKILNNTTYNVHNRSECIAVGSPLCSELITVDKKTLKLKYALDTFREGRNALSDKSHKDKPDELLFIWDKLQELIDNGQIKDIIEGNDEIENPIPVFTYDDEGNIIVTHTDVFGYPNKTFDGECMYENTHFRTKQEAVEKAIKEYNSAIECYDNMLKEAEEKVKKHKANKERYQSYLVKLSEINNPVKKEEQKLDEGMVTYEYGAGSSLYSLVAENKLTAYATIISHFNEFPHIVVVYKPEECKKDSWFSITGRISARLDEIFGGDGSFDKYLEENKDGIRACYETFKKIS
jgi:hypothetical protein